MIYEVKDIPPKAIEFLQKAIDKDPTAMDSIESIKLAIVLGQGHVFVVEKEEIVGAFTISLTPTAKQLFIQVGFLGGNDFDSWKRELEDFLRELCKQKNGKILFMGSKAWKKIFPYYEDMGSIFIGVPPDLP